MSTIYVIKKTCGEPISVTVDLDNGTTGRDYTVHFPIDKYSFLKTEPIKEGYKFTNWRANTGEIVSEETICKVAITSIRAEYVKGKTITFSSSEGPVTPSHFLAYEGFPLSTGIEHLPVLSGKGSLDFLCWRSETGIYVSDDTVYDGSYTSLSDCYGEFSTEFRFAVDTSVTAGIYSATRRDASLPVVVDWDDGTRSVVNGSISRLTHVIDGSKVNYYIKVSNNISAFALSSSDTSWSSTTTNNQSCVREITKMSSRISSLPSYAFYNLYRMTVTDACFEGSFTTIPSYCFCRCGYSLTSKAPDLTIPKRIISISNNAFQYCYNLGNIYFEERNGATLSIGTYAFSYINYYSSCAGNIVLPEGLTSIPNYAFYYASYMNSVTIPSTVTSIGYYAFYRCTRGKTITIKRTTAPTLGSYAFGNSSATFGYTYRTSGTNYLYLPSGYSGYNTTAWTQYLLSSSYGGFKIKEI